MTLRAAGHEAGDARRIEAGRVHEDEALCRHGLGVFIDLGHGGGAGFGDGAERFFVDRRQAAFLVAERGIVVDLDAEQAGVPQPPLDALDELLGDGGARGPPREQVLGAIDFGGFGQMPVPPQATIMSLATPSAGLAVTPLLPSEPPQLVPSTISLAGIGSRRTSFAPAAVRQAFRTPASIVFVVPPRSCMERTGGPAGRGLPLPPICSSFCDCIK